MKLFVVLPDGAKEIIYETAISPKCQTQLPSYRCEDINQVEIASMLDELVSRHDLWCYDERNNSDTRVQSFLAIEAALIQLKLVKYEQTTPNVEEWHIVNIAKRHAFSPWA